MEIKTHDKGYVIIFYGGKNPVSFDTKEDTMNLPIHSRAELVKLREKIDEIIEKEDHYD
jgi:hypothetical protein